jgi:hypothetical protein
VPILDDIYWQELRRKVYALDMMMELAYSRGGLPKRGKRINLGKITNIKMGGDKKRTTTGSRFEFFEDKSPHPREPKRLSDNPPPVNQVRSLNINLQRCQLTFRLL